MHLLDGDNPALDKVTESASQRHTTTTAIKLLTIDSSACIVGCDDATNRCLRTILITLAQHLVIDALRQCLYAFLFAFASSQSLLACMYSRFAMLLADILNLLAFFFFQFISSITDGNQHSRFFVFSDGEELLALLGIEVANPAGGEALLSGS